MDRMRRFLGRERVADLLLWLVITAPLLIPADPPQPTGLPLRWVHIAAVPLLALAVFLSRRAPVAAAAVPLALGLAATPELFTDGLAVAQLLMAYLLGRRSAGQRDALVLFVTVTGTGLLLLLITPDATAPDAFTLAGNVLLTLVLPWLVGRYTRQRAELERTGWQLAERLEREQELVGERARLQERSRIAADVHDSLGHDLSLIALRAAALQLAPDVGEQGRKASGELRQAAAAATERLGEVISVLRQDEEGAPVLPAGESVSSLVERASASGVDVELLDDLEDSGDPEVKAVPPMTDRAVYRVVQEGLTNATKHAPGSTVTVTLRREGTAAVVSVLNDAPPTEPRLYPAAEGTASGAYGLVRLDERIRQAGGTLRAGPVARGFAVTARLPLTAVAVPQSPSRVSTATQELAQARRKARRSMIRSIWVPVAGAVVLLLLMLVYRLVNV